MVHRVSEKSLAAGCRACASSATAGAAGATGPRALTPLLTSTKPARNVQLPVENEVCSMKRSAGKPLGSSRKDDHGLPAEPVVVECGLN
jgi:hypothetical protein